MRIIFSGAPVSVIPQEVTPRQAKIALKRAGLLGAIKAMINALPADDEIRLSWEESSVFKRYSPMVISVWGALGLGEAQLDELFLVASQIGD